MGLDAVWGVVDLDAVVLIIEALSGVPVGKDFSQLGDCRDFLTEDRGRGVFYCAGEKFKSMDDAIPLADCGLGEVVAHKLNGIRKKKCFGDGIGYTEAAIVVEC